MALGAKTAEETQIREVLEKLAQASRDRDLDTVMACYTPGIVSYDMMPPLEFRGIERYRKAWQAGFDMTEGQWAFEPGPIHIEISGDLAFAYRLQRMAGQTTTGEHADSWVRWTGCLRKVDGKWLIAHEHMSVPIEPESGKGAMNLKP